MPCRIEELEKIADEHGMKLMFDARRRFRERLGGRMIGATAAEVLSFHATKFINTFEGGAIVTNDDDLASRVRLMSNFGFKGFDNVDLSRHQRQDERGLCRRWG